MKSLFKHKGADSKSVQTIVKGITEFGKEYTPQIMEVGSEVFSVVSTVEAIKRSPKAAKEIQEEATRRAKEIDANTNKQVKLNLMDKFTVSFKTMWPVYASELVSIGLGLTSTTMSYTKLASMTAIAMAATKDNELTEALKSKVDEAIGKTKANAAEREENSTKHYQKMQEANRETSRLAGKRIIAIFEPFTKTLIRCTMDEWNTAIEHACCELAENGYASLSDIFDCIDGDLSCHATELLGWDTAHAYKGSLINYSMDDYHIGDEPAFMVVWDYEPRPIG